MITFLSITLTAVLIALIALIFTFNYMLKKIRNLRASCVRLLNELYNADLMIEDLKATDQISMFEKLKNLDL